jgi:hypothetical protein
VAEAHEAIATGRQALHILRQIDPPRAAGELQLVLDALSDDRASGEFREQIREETAPEHT